MGDLRKLTKVTRRKYAKKWEWASASARCLDRGDVDFLHLHHCLEGTFCLAATGRKRIG
jgi:hypothetical protein